MKSLSVIILLSSFSAISQDQPQLSVREIKTYTSEAKDLIKSFSLEGEVAPVGAPDYTLAKKLLLHNIQKKGPKLEKSFAALEERLKPSYNNIKSIEQLDGSKAEKATLKVAKERFKSQVESENTNYHKIIREYIAYDLEPVYKSCLTVLCVNKIKVDINKWIDHASKINRNLGLDYAKLEKYPNDQLKRDRKWINEEASDVSRSLELTIPLSDPRCENLNDEVAVDDLLKFGTKLIAETAGGVDALLKKVEEERIKKEEEDKKRKEEDKKRKEEEKRRRQEEEERIKKRNENKKKLSDHLNSMKDKTVLEIVKSLNEPIGGCSIIFKKDENLYQVFRNGKPANLFTEKDAVEVGAPVMIEWIQQTCFSIY